MVDALGTVRQEMLMSGLRARVFALGLPLWVWSAFAAHAQGASPSSACLQSSLLPSEEQAGGPCPYGEVEYLLWWVKGAPLSIPLVSTGPIGSTHHGWLNSPDSTVLYGAALAPAQGGNGTQGFGPFSGSRLTLGAWTDASRRYAVEVSGFFLERRTAGYSINSDASGLPVINIPVYNTIPYAPGGRPSGGPPAEDGLPASLPLDPDRFDGDAGVFAGGVKITNSLQLWGVRLAASANLLRRGGWEVDGLVGPQYLNLSEGFYLGYSSIGISGFYNGQSGVANDSFKTRNSFYGAGFGVRARYSFGLFSGEATGRLGLGANNQVLNVGGGFLSYNFITPVRSGPEGVFAQPSNEGRFSSMHFAVVPEVQLKLSYDITTNIRLTLAYDFLFISNVIRPTDQIDRNIPKGQTFLQGGDVVSSTSPARKFQSTNFFAQGISTGLSFRF